MNKIILVSEGIRQLLKSTEMMTVCEEQAAIIRQRLGSGYSTNTHVGRLRVNVEVTTDTKEALNDCLKNNTLLKAVRM